MKKLANLKGVKALNRIEQKSINGGTMCPGADPDVCNSCYYPKQCVIVHSYHAPWNTYCQDWACVNFGKGDL